MRPRYTRRRIEWDRLESRDCPAGFVGPAPSPAPSPTPPPPAPSPPPPYLTEIPVERTDALSTTAVAIYNQQLSAWPSQIAFFGDSITYDFAYQAGVASWARTMAPLAAISLGVPGDRTQNLLWRIGAGGELRDHPKVAIVEIGTNNLVFYGDGVAATVAGIEKVVATIHAHSPGTNVLLVGMLPTGKANSPFRPEIVAVNAALAKFAVGPSTTFLNVGPSLIAPDGSIAANFQSDLVHPNADGDILIADALLPVIRRLMGDDPPRPPVPAPTPAPSPSPGPGSAAPAARASSPHAVLVPIRAATPTARPAQSVPTRPGGVA